MEHLKDINVKEYARLKSGLKNFYISDEDEGFQKGDLITFKEYDDEPINRTSKKEKKGYTGRPDLKYKIGHVSVVTSSIVVFSLLPVS